MFRGSFDLRTDDKGRIIVPLKFRADLGATFILTKGINFSLFIMTEEVWNKNYEEKFTTDRFLDEDLMRVERFFREGWTEATPDNQGRIAISQRLREYAGIGMNSDVFMIGMGSRIELWTRDRWENAGEEKSHKTIIEAASRIGMGRVSF